MGGGRGSGQWTNGVGRAEPVTGGLELLRAAKAIFPRAQKLALAPDNAELEPTYGLQRDLIRLVGNLACRHPGMQQLVRHHAPGMPRPVRVCA